MSPRLRQLLCSRPPRRYPQIDFPTARSQVGTDVDGCASRKSSNSLNESLFWPDPHRGQPQMSVRVGTATAANMPTEWRSVEGNRVLSNAVVLRSGGPVARQQPVSICATLTASSSALPISSSSPSRRRRRITNVEIINAAHRLDLHVLRALVVGAFERREVCGVAGID